MGAVAEAVVDVVSDVVESVGDVVSDIGREVSHAAENVVREVGQAAETVGREVGKAAEDVGKVIETVGQTIAENPITAIAIVAVAVAAPYALPAATAALGTTAGVIAVGATSGAIVGAAGAVDRGSSILEPALKGALIGGATAGLAPQLTSGLSALGAPSAVATTIGSGLAGAAGGAGAAALNGGDVGLGALSGGLGSAVGAGTQIGTNSRLVGTLAGTTAAGLSAGLGGREVAGRAILAGLQGVLASSISQQLQPKLQETNQKFSSAQSSISGQYSSTKAEYDRVYAEANSLQNELEQTRQRLLAIQSIDNPTQQNIDEFDRLYATYQNQQNQFDGYNNRLNSLAGQANNLKNQYASLGGAYQNEVAALENQAKQQYAALERQAGLLPGELAKEDPITEALVKEYLSAQSGGLPKSLGQFASSQGTTDVPMITLAGQTVDGDAISVDDPLYTGNKLNLQQAMLRGEALDAMYQEAIQQNNPTKLELLNQARIENAQVITTLWNTVVGQGDSGQYAALLGTPSGGGEIAGGSLSGAGGIMSVDLPFVPIAYVYNKSNPEQVSVMADNGVTYSLVNVDGRELLQNNTTNQFVVELTKDQVKDIRNESNASVQQAQEKEKEAELKPSKTTGGGGGGGGGGGNEGSTGTSGESGRNILDDIIRIESQIAAAGSAPIGTYTSPDISAARDTGRVLGTSQAVATGTTRPGGGGGSGLGDLFSQGFGTTEFGRGEGVGAGEGAGTGTGSGGGRGSGTGGGTGSGFGDGSGSGSGTGRGSGKGSGTGSGEGAGTGGLANLTVGGIGGSGTLGRGGAGAGAGGVLYPSVGTSALAQALNIVPDLGGGGGDVDPSRSLNKKKPVWNIESLKLKDALGA